MRVTTTLLTSCLMACALTLACVDPWLLTLRATNDVIVVDGTITNLAEAQTIHLNRSQADSVTGQFGTLPLTKAQVEVVVDSSLVIACHETRAGSYQLPSDFKGQIGHAYQLRFTLSDGTQYLSTPQIMQPVPPIGKVTAKFNPKAFPTPFSDNVYTAGHELFVDFTDPVNQRNYYRWRWTLYETQKWCRSCYEGVYAKNLLQPLAPAVYPYYYVSTQQSYEDCFSPPTGSFPRTRLSNQYADYLCRTQCWEIIPGYGINVFSDQYSNGGLITNRSVAHIPFYQQSPCLIDIRQESLPIDAYQYYDLFQQQTQRTGGLSDTPPSALGGNIHNRSNQSEVVIGYFTASAVSVTHYYLLRNDTQGQASPGLFYALNGRSPVAETYLDFILNLPNDRTALCVPLDERTPIKPAGWP
ncbi:DUF4249 domain-containing protein [Spirosoma panaciterrae]|uniref:DUF4249 domain-containing protein n=1 Tax=Spirosoma panaciterrae TaxID=496058 RepID=UPI00036BA6EA|nr:DUF4249 domain-containing protein [Spirosoma panaciterrae]